MQYEVKWSIETAETSTMVAGNGSNLMLRFVEVSSSGEAESLVDAAKQVQQSIEGGLSNTFDVRRQGDEKWTTINLPLH